jgi:hypothetical protein
VNFHVLRNSLNDHGWPPGGSDWAISRRFGIGPRRWPSTIRRCLKDNAGLCFFLVCLSRGRYVAQLLLVWTL